MTRKVAGGPARLEQCRGHLRWRDDSTGRVVHVHQLVLIAQGADPVQVFSNGEYQGHHGNGVRWDNRHSNLALVHEHEHQVEYSDKHTGWPGNENWTEASPWSPAAPGWL